MKFFTFLANKQCLEFSIQSLENCLLNATSDNDKIDSKVFQVEMQIVSVRDMLTKQLNEILKKITKSWKEIAEPAGTTISQDKR